MGRQCSACESSRSSAVTAVGQKITQRLPAQCRGPLTACRFTIAFTSEVVIGVGPQTYRPERARTAFTDTLNKITSTRGFALGARLAPRFAPALPQQRPVTAAAALLGARNNHARMRQENAHPFNSSAKRPSIFKVLPGPGPGSYEVCSEKAPKRIPFQHHLGHGRTITVPVKVICNRGQPVKCKGCEDVLKEDFWLSRGRVLCNKCKLGEVGGRGLVFQKARDCREDHRHEGTDVAIRLKQKDKEKRARVREAYLDLYFKDD